METRNAKQQKLKEPDFRIRLQRELLDRCKRNPGYSMRAFAKSLRIDHSTLAKILKGERRLGPRALSRLATRLGLSPSETQQYLMNTHPNEVPADEEYLRIAADSFQIISEWFHFAILELLTVEGFRPEPKWIARTLGLTTAEVHSAVERLRRAGMIEITSDGSWHDLSGGKTTNIGPDMRSNALRLLQKQILEGAIHALESVPIEYRDQTAMTMAIDTDLLPKAREKITRFRRSLAKFLCRGRARKEVYQLSLSLYPVSHVNQRK